MTQKNSVKKELSERSETRLPIASGSFYPSDKLELTERVSDLISQSGQNPLAGVKALIVPHSGYDYVGSLYGKAYSAISDSSIDEVFALSGSFFHKLESVSFCDLRFWEIPNGKVEVSHRLDKIIHSDDPSIQNILKRNNSVHMGEHSIEVQLPFLMEALGSSFRLIPTMIDGVSPRLAANALVEQIDQNDLLIGVSELSRGYPKDYAIDIDKVAIDSILQMDTDKIQSEMFEASFPLVIAVVNEIAKAKSWKPQLLEYTTCPISQENPRKVIGCVAIAYTQ
ncbi:AmmeMemoRadiSam system protein B [Candidatus Dojkabacteria bacterium]|uniref:AmmeMemoRadiSam system protein B n=1 Tax=Candidatus Dojkabacteria bacterium TaxID=2099670 RepID=A0A955KVV5_9BACT|nr:AmmeMemoRadiSam system protein B [Candidatus Dojkabacteria bacterium]